jgi:hypothetical protein
MPDLPPELRPTAPRLLVPGSARPQPEDMIFCPPTPEDLELPTPTLGEVIQLVAEVPFEPAMRAMSVLAAELHHHPQDRERHLELGADLYQGEVGAKFKTFVGESSSHVGFDARHVAALQRLLVMHAAPDLQTVRDLSRPEADRLAGALLGLASALPHGDLPEHDPASPADWAAWARYMTLIAAWHHESDLLEAIARAHAMYVDVHGDPALADHHARCEVDKWMEEEYGLALGEQLAGSLACAMVSRALDADAAPRERLIHIEPGFLRAGGLAAKEPALVKLISASRQELQDLMLATSDDPAHVAWDHTAFEQRPYLRALDGTLRLISPRALQSWMTRGMHHRALQAAEHRPHPRKPGKNAALVLLGYEGTLGEEAVRRLMRTSHNNQLDLGTVTLHGEHSYKIGKQRHDSPDLLLDYGNDLVVVEIFSGRIPREARTSLDKTLLLKAMDKATTDKLLELSARLRELLDRALTYDGVELNRVRRIWPVLVHAGDPIFQNPALWQYLHHVAPDAFLSDARVKRPTILNLDDLEPLLALIQEEGKLLPELLSEILASPYAELPPRNWVHATFGGIRRRPRYVDEQAQAALRLAATTLFPNSERMRNLTLAK